MDSQHRSLRGRLLAIARIVTALALVAGAAELVRLHLDLKMQRIHLRYAHGTSDDDRVSIEQQFGLVEGIDQESRTWSYVLRERSPDRVQELLSDPLIEDTHNIDRSSFRVVFDRPDLPALLRVLAQEGWLPWVATLLALGAATILWSARQALRDGWRRTLASGAQTAVALTTPASASATLFTLVAVGIATAAVLPLGVEGRPDEAAFVHLYEAPSILAGDHPYRDFFEWGAPLPALLSAGAQRLVGYRVIGELLLQWAFTIAGVVVAIHLGLRQAHSTASVLAVLPLTLLLAARGGYHFSKLFCIPLGIWCAWRYMDDPTTRRSAVLGFVTAIGFLFRHDYAIWAGLSAMLAFLLVRLVVPELRTVRSLAAHGAAYALAAALALLPWAVVVSNSEGLLPYFASRAERFGFSRSAGTVNPYRSLFPMNPVRQLRTARLPAPAPGIVSFEWAPHVDDQRKQELEQQHRLQPQTTPGATRPTYSIPNIYDVSLLPLLDHIQRDTGFNWTLLDLAKRGMPPREGVDLWMAQMTMLVPIVLIVSGLAEALRVSSGSGPVGVPALQRILAGIVLAGVNETLLREWSYFMAVGPVTAALGARFLSWGPARSLAASSFRAAPARRFAGVLGIGVAATLVALTTYAATVFRPPLLAESMSETIRHVRNSMAEWLTKDAGGGSDLHLYLRECTTPSDRLLITGSTPYYVPYYTKRPMAGGHLDWSVGLRADPGREAQSLELLKKQSVPFVIGRGENVIDEFQRYPRIRAYLAENFEPVEGSGGSLLYDRRRPVARTYGPTHLPCFL